MLIEDDERERKAVARILRARGYHVLGTEQFIQKPFAPEKLVGKLQELLDA